MSRPAKQVLMVLGFGLIAGPIAWGLLAEAKTARTRQLIADIQAAERDAVFTGVRTLTSYDNGVPVTVVQRVSGASPWRRRVEMADVEGAPKGRRGRPGHGINPMSFMLNLQGALSGPGLGSSGLQSRFGDPSLVEANYRLSSRGRETIAGRDAEAYDLKTRFTGRADYRLWVDHATRYLLQFQVWQADTLVFESSHRSITFGTVGGAKFPDPKKPGFLDVTREALQDGDLTGRPVPFATFLPSDLPDGFVRRELVKVRVKVIGMSPFTALQATYTDGVATMMLLEFDANDALWKQIREWLAFGSEPPTPSPKGAIVAQRVAGRGGCAIKLATNGTEIIASGQVGPEELERLVKSLKKADGR